MIHVEPQPEPEGFETKVRQKGLKDLRQKNIALDRPLPTIHDRARKAIVAPFIDQIRTFRFGDEMVD